MTTSPAWPSLTLTAEFFSGSRPVTMMLASALRRPNAMTLPRPPLPLVTRAFSLGGAQGSEGAKATSEVRRPPGRRRAERLVEVRRVSAGGDEMPGHATRRQVIAGVLVPRGVRAGTDVGRTRAGRRRQWPSPHCLRPKSDGPHFGLREKW